MIHLFLYQDMLTQLRAIFDLIVQFENAQSNLYTAAEEEVRNRQQLRDAVNKKTDKVHYNIRNCTHWYSPSMLYRGLINYKYCTFRKIVKPIETL